MKISWIIQHKYLKYKRLTSGEMSLSIAFYVWFYCEINLSVFRWLARRMLVSRIVFVAVNG